MTTDYRSLRVLVVEDHPTMLRTMTQMIELLGHRAVAAGGVAEACAAGACDLVLCDYRLADGEASHVRAALRERGVRVPMILLTAYDAHALDAAETDGFDAVLTKPLDMRTLGDLLARHAGSQSPGA